MSLALSACVACYNEVSTLEPAIREVVAALRTVPGSHEVIIVDDGSTDGSGPLADELARRLDLVRVVHHERNLGLGGYYRTSFREARCDVLYFMAADLQPIPAEYVATFLPLFATHEVVIGYDLKREAPLVSRALSAGEKLIFAFLFPGVPKVGGPLMIRRRVVQAFDLRFAATDDRSWLVLWELLVRAKRAGVTFAQVPVRRRPRLRGASRGSTIRTALIMLRGLHRLRRVLAAP